MSQRQSPQTEIRGGVRDRAQHVFDGVDGLMYENFADRLIIVSMSAAMWNRCEVVWVLRCHFQAKIDVSILADDLILLLPRHHYVERLAQQHPRDAGETDEDKSPLECALEREHEFLAAIEHR